MSVIKAAQASGVLRFEPVAPLIATPLPDPALLAAEARCAELERELEAAKVRERQAVADAFEDGAQSVRRDDATHLALVRAALADAAARWDERLADAERLAVTLARTALGRVVDEADDLAGLTARTIRHHVAAIGAHAVVRVRVSALDFPDMGDLPDLAVVDAGLASGEARLDLLLGEAELDLRSQMAALDVALARLGEAA